MDIQKTIGDISKFDWREAVNNVSGQSSAGLFIAFWYGIALTLLTIFAGIAYFIKWIQPGEINNIFIFVGIQMPIDLGYLLGQKNLDEKNSPTKTTTITSQVNTIEKTEAKKDEDK